ncbi:MAG: carboxypeptidase M32 [Clostridiales bacterium]|nr:carboxypeptidase M32 [Clostridiales bacterium]MDD7310271.1 carboxypeptidase M32 [Eubacteriales bacterium]MDY5347274.1 carboxypeptidase M32 [Eubacteriales bacterium]
MSEVQKNVAAALEQLKTLQAKMHAYHHAMSMIYYDSVTTAPEGTDEGRGETLSILSGESHALFASPETDAMLKTLEANSDALTPEIRRQAELLRRDYQKLNCIPQDEYMDYQKLVNRAQTVWHQAKGANDFASFAPYLEKLIAAKKRFASLSDPEKAPYDVLLDEYEPGMTRSVLDRFFAQLRSDIVPLIESIRGEHAEIRDDFLFRFYPADGQRRLADRVMEVMGIDRRHCGLGETLHPFTLEFNNKDVRITTNYDEHNLISSLYSVVHEGGHAIYELHSPDAFENTCLAGGVSMGVHESQSRLYENILGRSRAFVSVIFPICREIFPEQLADVAEEEMYRAVNKCVPSLIRTEADEVTYCLHVMVRYEIEKGLFDGSIQVADLPKVWAEKMQAYLGVSVPDDTHGVLQDSHWSGGDFGYFPSYAIGSAYGAQIAAKLSETLDLDEAIRSGRIPDITARLSDGLYRFGRLYNPAELIERFCGKPFDPSYYTAYLTKKYRG